mgnify:FL=1
MTKEAQKIKLLATPILKKAGVKSSALFCSFARGEHKKNSDIDIMVEFKTPTGFFAFSDLKTALERKLNKKVDLVTAGGISRFLRRRIARDKIRIL